jgi:hypothetical protein
MAPENGLYMNRQILNCRLIKYILQSSIADAALRRETASIPRHFTPPVDHFFLLGLRGTGKTWLIRKGGEQRHISLDKP